MARLGLSLACWGYDHVAALTSGQVRAEGLDLNVHTLGAEEIFFRMLKHREFDAAEMSLSSYCLTLARDDPPFVAIPVFPSRLFRHACIFVNARSGIETPSDLAGKTVGVPEYQITASVWIRGMLRTDYGVDPRTVRYRTGGQEEPGREEKITLDLPSGFEVKPIGPGQTLSGMLANGEIDALYTARTPSSYAGGSHQVRRLFENYAEVERDYFTRTRIFPIMHLIAIRREVYEQNRWVARSLLKAFTEAQALARQALLNSGQLRTMLPWQIAEVERTVSVMGDDWWPYGVDANRHVLEAFTAFHHEQGLSPRRLAVDELFAPETLSEHRI